MRLGLVGDQVDVVRRAREVGAQVDGSGVEAGEHEAPVAVDLGRREQAHARAVESRAIAILAGQAVERSGAAVRPRVVEAVHAPGVALGNAADQRPAMPATVVEDPLDAVVAVPEHQRPVADVAGPEVARLRDLRLVADVEPAAIEDRAHLVAEHVLVGQRGAVDAERPGRDVLDHPVRRCRGERFRLVQDRHDFCLLWRRFGIRAGY